MTKTTLSAIIACLTIAILTGCTAPAAPSAKSAADASAVQAPATIDPFYGRWNVVSASDADGPIDVTSGVHVSVWESGPSGGSTLCNSMGADIQFAQPRWSGDAVVADFSVTYTFMTEVGCVDEERYAGALAGATEARVVDDELRLTGADATLTFEREAGVEREKLVDRTWELSNQWNSDNTTQKMTGITIVYDDEGTFAASVGCQRLTGRWELNRSVVTTSEVAATIVTDCPDLTLEADFVRALSNPYRVVTGDEPALYIASKELDSALWFSDYAAF